MKKKEFAIIGLGRFGISVVNALVEHGQKVIAFDSSPERVKLVADKVDFSAAIDSTDIEALQEMGISNVDYAIVAIGSDIQASIMTVAALNELGVKNIIAKTASIRMSQVLSKIGATEIISPEHDSGLRLAQKLLHMINVKDIICLDKNYAIIYLKINEDIFEGKTLAELELRKNYQINIVSIIRDDAVFIPQFDDKIIKDDMIIIVGKNADLLHFENVVMKGEV